MNTHLTTTRRRRALAAVGMAAGLMAIAAPAGAQSAQDTQVEPGGSFSVSRAGCQVDGAPGKVRVFLHSDQDRNGTELPPPMDADPGGRWMFTWQVPADTTANWYLVRALCISPHDPATSVWAGAFKVDVVRPAPPATTPAQPAATTTTVTANFPSRAPDSPPAPDRRRPAPPRPIPYTPRYTG
jgi:hypothetical protein